MPSVIMTCRCEHEWQDKKYGHKQRVFNLCKGGKARCTVCGNEVQRMVAVPVTVKAEE